MASLRAIFTVDSGWGWICQPILDDIGTPICVALEVCTTMRRPMMYAEDDPSQWH